MILEINNIEENSKETYVNDNPRELVKYLILYTIETEENTDFLINGKKWANMVNTILATTDLATVPFKTQAQKVINHLPKAKSLELAGNEVGGQLELENATSDVIKLVQGSLWWCCKLLVEINKSDNISIKK